MNNMMPKQIERLIRSAHSAVQSHFSKMSRLFSITTKISFLELTVTAGIFKPTDNPSPGIQDYFSLNRRNKLMNERKSGRLIPMRLSLNPYFFFWLPN